MKGFKRLTVIALCALICLGIAGNLPASAAKRQLIIGGMNFGVKFFTDGLLVVGTTDIPTAEGIASPSKDKIKVKDFITHLNGQKLTASEQLAEGVKASEGKELVLTVKDTEGNERQQKITPVINKQTGEWCIGVFVRDSTAGIGTVTYIDAETASFGGLGHGICDTDTGALLTVGKAYVVDVNVTEITKGVGRTPGEIKGIFGKKVTGEIYKNLPVGVFGKLNSLPEGQLFDVAKKGEIKEGKATVHCQIDGKVGQYEIEISKIYKDSGATKNFLIKVTDKALLSATGGIVQGMSGSPITQNGKIVGAVTHVLVSDHTKGYGIFIENMLSQQ